MKMLPRGISRFLRLAVVLIPTLGAGIVLAQQTTQSGQCSQSAHDQMPGMKHDGNKQGAKTQKPAASAMGHGTMAMQPESFVANVLHHSSSGTSAEPNSTPTPMLMTTKGQWRLMFHGSAWINELQQSGPRGHDKFFSTNWFMPMAQRNLGPGQLTLRTMLSLEPATVTDRRYPELFQLGETAFGKPDRKSVV